MTTASLHSVDLDPSLLEHRTYTSRRRRTLIDLSAMLILMVMTLFLIPAQLIVPQLTDVGRPALIIGLVIAASWWLSKLHPRLAMRGPQPLRWAMAIYLMAMLAGYAAGFMRGLPQLEANSADRSMIGTLIFIGVALACADNVASRARLDDILRVTIWCGAIMAIIGLVQFGFSYDLTKFLQLPGLKVGGTTGDLIGFEERGDGFFRVGSTATHYIEFSAVMAMCVPLGIHFARFGRSPIVRQIAAVATCLMGVAIPATLSRTGFLALFVVMLAMMPAWSWRMRLNIGVPGLGLLAALMVVQPGLLGTIRSMFLGMSNDPSIQGRTEDYELIFAYVADRPWFGRGPGTFVPSLYFIVDNEWLQHLVGGGYVGLLALLIMHITAFTLAVIAFRRASTDEDRSLCACLIGAQLVVLVANSTFDAMGFTTYATLLALLTGATGAMWRFTHPARLVRSAGSRLDT